MIIVEWGNDAISHFESGWWQPHTDGPEAATQLYGTWGFGQIFPTKLEIPKSQDKKIDVIDSGLPFPRQKHTPQSLYDTQLKYFVECIKSNEIPKPGGREGLVNMKVVDAAYESARTGKVVEIKQ